MIAMQFMLSGIADFYLIRFPTLLQTPPCYAEHYRLGASIARRIGLVSTLRLTVIICTGGSGSSGAHADCDATAYRRPIDVVVVVSTAVIAAHVTCATAPASEGERRIRSYRDTGDPDCRCNDKRDNGLTGHDRLLTTKHSSLTHRMLLMQQVQQ